MQIFGLKTTIFFIFKSRGLGATYVVHFADLKLIGKPVVDFLFGIKLTVTDTENRVFARMGSVWPNISGTRGRPTNHFFLSEN